MTRPSSGPSLPGEAPSRGTIPFVKRTATVTRVLPFAALLALASLLSGCTLSSYVPSTNLVGQTPTAGPNTLPTALASNAASSGYDTGTGNCRDAAAQAIDLINGASVGRYGGVFLTLDMRLDLDPHNAASGCGATGRALSFYRQDAVGTASLTVWALDTVWASAQGATRHQWLTDVLASLIRIYPKALVTIHVLYDGAPCGGGSISFGRGAEHINDACN